MSVAAFADELEREKARQRTYDAMQRKARAGHVTGGRVFGYDNVEVLSDPDAQGRQVRQRVERRINENEAAIVRRIFELSAAGTGLRREGMAQSHVLPQLRSPRGDWNGCRVAFRIDPDRRVRMATDASNARHLHLWLAMVKPSTRSRAKPTTTRERAHKVTRFVMLTNAEGFKTSRYLGPALRHERFVAEYLIDLNKTAAYKRAGYRARGHAAEVNASRLSLRPEVQRLIRLRQRESFERIGWVGAEPE